MISFLNNKTFQIVFLLYSSALIFLGRQLDTGLKNYDDAYYAQKARELLESGNFWLITHRGIPDFANPPLPFWLTAVSYKIFGVSSYAAVFFSAILAIATVYLTYSLAHWLYRDRWIAFASAFVLLFPGIFDSAARRGMLDVTLAFFVTAAMFCLFRALEDRRFYLLFGLMTAAAVLTKSILGFFPLICGTLFLIWSGKKDRLLCPYFLAGAAIAIVIGSTWYIANIVSHGNDFIDFHFGALLLQRGFSEIQDPFYFLGYAKDLLKNYWPWVPVLVVGLVGFGKTAFREKDLNSKFILLWIAVIFAVMSTSKTQTLRYLFMIFPAMSILVAKTVADWLREDRREKCLPYIVGVLMVTVVVINITPIKIKHDLAPNNPEARRLAPVVFLNTPPENPAANGGPGNEQRKRMFPCHTKMIRFAHPLHCVFDVGNYRLPYWNPRNILMFYSNRILSDPAREPEELERFIDRHPQTTWLTAAREFKYLQEEYPGKFYLIQANEKFAYFTSAENRDNIRYDFSGIKLPLIR